MTQLDCKNCPHRVESTGTAPEGPLFGRVPKEKCRHPENRRPKVIGNVNARPYWCPLERMG